jgi:hypothetical protein
MFDQNDIESLQEHINVIWASEASPDIILMGRERVSLKEASRNLPINRCSLLILYNRYKDRSWQGGIIGLTEVAAAISYSSTDIDKVIDIIGEDDFLSSLIDGDIRQSITSLYQTDIVVQGETPLLVSEYVKRLDYGVKRSYKTLRGMMNIAGRILSIKAIIGGIFFGLETRFSRDDLVQALFGLENRSSPRFIEIEKIEDYIEWYRSKRRETLSVPSEGKAATRVDQVGFYPESFRRLDKIEKTSDSRVYTDLQTYTPQVKTQRYTIHPPIEIDTIDLISSASTSRDLPLIAANIEGKKIIKSYNRTRTGQSGLNPSWFMDIDINTMKIYVKTSHTKEKYQLVKYFIDDNYFLLESDSRRLPIDDIISILCSHLDVYWITKPETYSSTYSFVSNRIPIDRNVLAWLITNPPTEYANAGLDQYVFVKEESKPNALKDKTNIHIQLGEDKMYISTSQSKSTSGTLVPRSTSPWIGFEPDQQFFNVSINRTPNRSYANICMNIYRHVMAMYFKYYARARLEIVTLAMEVPNNPPTLLRLREREPTRAQEFKHIDPDLYNHTSIISDTILPIPIDRDEAEVWRSRGHAIIHLPNVILNYPSINILTSEEIWLRTPKPGKFILVQKSNNDYIPVQATGTGFGIILEVGIDGTIEGKIQHVTVTERVLGEKSSTFAKVDRLAAPSDTLNVFLRSLADPNSSIYRMGITPNILQNLNMAMRMTKTPLDVSRYAYLCRQECWSQETYEVESDILTQRIDPQRHFRALEETFSVNLYFLEEDMVEPRILKPPHHSFYLHRRGNPKRKTVIFHKDRDEWTLVIQRGLTSRLKVYFFDKGVEYLDRIMDETNIIHMISPENGRDDILTYRTPSTLISGWKAYEQVVDDYGKVRAITYKSGSRVGTIFVGFSPLLSPVDGVDIPIGDIVEPTARSNAPEIVRSIPWMKEEYLLYPKKITGFDSWKKTERDARVLRAVCVLLCSQSKVDIDTFIDDMLVVRENVSYDTSRLKNSLPPVSGDDAWRFFADVLGGEESYEMVHVDDLSKYIVIPSESVRDALRLYLFSNTRVAWPTSFPHYVVYTWDIKSSSSESVFLSQEHALANLMMNAYPTESDEMIVSPVAYILKKGNDRYLMQMGRDDEHIRCLAYEWINNRRNVGISGYCDEDIDDLPEVPSVTSFSPRVERISWIFYNGHPFLIIPL